MNHYLVVYRFFFFSAFMLFLFFLIISSEGHKFPIFIICSFLTISIAAIIMAFWLLWLQNRRLRLVTIETKFSRKEIKKIILELSKEFDWEIDLSNKEILIAIASPRYFFSLRKKRITFLFDEGRVLVNSINIPLYWEVPYSYKRNKKNIKIIRERINAASSK